MNAPLKFPRGALASASPHYSPTFVAAVEALATIEGGFIVIDADDFARLEAEHVVKPAAPVAAAKVAEPTVKQMATNFVAAMATWASAGFPIAEQSVYEVRAPICQSCDKYKKILGLYHGCSICGCTSVKLHLATSKCPLAKW